MFEVMGASSFGSHLLEVQNQNEISLTIPTGPIGNCKTYTMRRKYINSIISFTAY